MSAGKVAVQGSTEFEVESEVLKVGEVPVSMAVTVWKVTETFFDDNSSEGSREIVYATKVKLLSADGTVPSAVAGQLVDGAINLGAPADV